MADPGERENPRKMPPEELRARVIFSLLMPAARVALGEGKPLKSMKRLIELALYQEARKRRLKMKEISDLLSVSMSKVGLLSKDLKEHYAQPEREQGLARKVLTLLWAGPMSEQKIVAAIGEDDKDDIRAAIEELLEDRRLEEEPGRTVVRYKLGAPQHRLVAEPWMARIDALNNLMASLVRAVEARFFAGDGRAFARTLSFRARPEDIPRLQAQYEALFQLICELDEAVDGETGSVPLSLSIFWAPTDDDETPDEE